MGNLTIRIPDELRKDLEQVSREQNRPISDLVRESVRQYVVAAKIRALREKIRPYAEAHGFFTDEDVFEAIS